MYELTWKQFKIKNILNCSKTEIVLKFLNNYYMYQKPNTILKARHVETRLSSYIDTYYSNIVFSIYKNKLILYKHYLFKFPDEFKDILPIPNEFNDLYYYDMTEEHLLYLSLKFSEFQIENITNLKPIEVYDTNLIKIYKK